MNSVTLITHLVKLTNSLNAYEAGGGIFNILGEGTGRWGTSY